MPTGYTADVPEILGRLVDLAAALGVMRINELPGCWEHQIDDQWHVSVNGHNDERRSSRGIDVPPFAALFEFNGWPACVVNAGGGTVVAGSVANEDALIAAILAATSVANEDALIAAILAATSVANEDALIAAILAATSVANEDALIAAILAATKKELADRKPPEEGR